MRIAYRTDNVPAWGMGAFTPVPGPTPLASTGGEQKRYLAQFNPVSDPMLRSYAATRPDDTAYQGSYADPPPGLPLAFIPHVPNWVHGMRYWTTTENMGPNGPNDTMKIYSDNVLPLPAGNYGRVPAAAMKQPPWATIVATPWPRPFISWPTWGKSRSA